MSRLKTLQSMLVESPEDSFLQFALAKEYEKIENPDKALDAYLTLLKKDPDYIGLYYHLGKLYEELGDITKALEIYDRGIILAKKLPDFHALSELNNARLNCELEN